MPMQTVEKTNAVKVAHSEDNSENTDGSDSSDAVEWDPWNPPYPPRPAFPPTADFMTKLQMIKQHGFRIQAALAASRSTNIIAPDRTPQVVLGNFCKISGELELILKRDSVRSFLRLYKENVDCMAWGYIITPQTLNLIIARNALRCAKLVLEGKAPAFCQMRANPNCMTSSGYFPLHQAAENFSVDMIKLLLRYGASANLRTSGEKVIEGLLPLHVAIEDTCMHKYLEDNLLTDQKHKQVDFGFIYKLVHLLCLPEMKIFLATTRLLADYTDNLLDELWNYIKEGKLVHAAILLLAAQRRIRTCASSNRNIKHNPSGFTIIKDRIMGFIVSIETEWPGLTSGRNSKAYRQLEEKRMLFCNALVLNSMISEAGEALDEYIQTHSEVSHREILESVSSILKDHGFDSAGKGINIGELKCCPYDCGEPDSLLKSKHEKYFMTEAGGESPNLNMEAKNAVGYKPPSRWELEKTKNMFFPFWRSVLKSRRTVKVFPSYAPMKDYEQFMPKLSTGGSSENKLKDKGSFPVHVGLFGKNSQLTSIHRSRRLFGTAAFTLLKMLKRA
ncbi:uncharacterized protein LOC107304289 isoform X1 [Oryza brachyantha]|nr:uncharacterized protein LOC107304289 isoform X1 [Oryza brachyantha]XP_040379924.1 uncharacterized protein LOC107304289 isoform X1 [Oryza brachyantha]